MRFALAVAGVVAAGALVHADVIVRQRSVSGATAGGPREETVYLGAQRVVTESDAMRTIVDLDRRTITAADKTKRTYTVLTFDELNAQMAALKQQLDALPEEARRAMAPLLEDGPPVAVTATGKSQTIAGHRASEHALKGGVYSGSVWSTEDIPTPAAFIKWKEIERSGQGPGTGRQLGAAMQKIPGFPLRTRIETKTAGGTVVLSNEVLSLREGETPKDLLAVPPGFAKQELGAP
jgi:hypothetical protein